jgi:hypothetical protein
VPGEGADFRADGGVADWHGIGTKLFERGSVV